MCTVEYIRHLPSYNLGEFGTFTDPWVENIFNELLDFGTRDALKEYTRGEYSLDLHYRSFLQYARPWEEEMASHNRCNNNVLLWTAFDHTR